MSRIRNFRYLLFSFLFVFFTPSYALDAVTLSYGYSYHTDVNMGRISAQWDWKTWLEESPVQFASLMDLSYGYMHDSDSDDGKFDPHVFAFTPLWRLQMRDPIAGLITPFLEVGIGISLFTETRADHRKLSTVYQFEDHIGLGFKLGKEQKYDLKVSYWHYSNADLKRPNSGVNFIMTTFGYRL